ncbi:M14 family zinc carboxypeptidase [Halobacteriovorax sp.]|uniref:M14 family zinc carboxypeptidase n=1 Tax=Halobacteriovorax sp. TaxID=2020862 RepID=UPI0035655B3C
MKKILLSLLIVFNSNAVCVHEYDIQGHTLLSQLHTLNEKTTFYQKENGTFEEVSYLKNIHPHKSYRIQETQPHIKKDYDDRYIKYYQYQRVIEFLSEIGPSLEQLDYKTEVIGKSLENRNLYSIFPKTLDRSKQVILMFARHHGDEGTANWIVEGFLKKALASKKFNDKFQIVLYPMINPDGAQAKRRYNKKGRDLNRSWGSTPSKSYDEIKTIQNHLNKVLLSKTKPIIALDMHGSFTEDFIYRVSKSFAGKDFFNLQQEFISSLSERDQWQAGQYNVSNGHKKMSRILLVRDFNINSLTHESIRDIPLTRNRTLQHLEDQGRAIVDTLIALY